MQLSKSKLNKKTIRLKCHDQSKTSVTKAIDDNPAKSELIHGQSEIKRRYRTGISIYKTSRQQGKPYLNDTKDQRI